MAAYRLRLGSITDEIDQDLETALRVTTELGMDYVEVRRLWDKDVVDLTDEEAKEAKRMVDSYGLKVSVLSTACFKPVLLGHGARGAVVESPDYRRDLAALERAIELTKIFETPLIIVFSFRRDGMVGLGNPSPMLSRGGKIPDEILEKVWEGLTPACDRAARAGVTLALENVRSCWGNSGENTRQIVDAVGSPVLKVNWDPANAYVSGGLPYPDGYELVKEHMVHFHLKDAAICDGETGLTRWEAVGVGEVDLLGQLRALVRDGYDGVVSLETHWRKEGGTRIDSTRVSFRGLQDLLARA